MKKIVQSIAARISDIISPMIPSPFTSHKNCVTYLVNILEIVNAGKYMNMCIMKNAEDHLNRKSELTLSKSVKEYKEVAIIENKYTTRYRKCVIRCLDIKDPNNPFSAPRI